MKDFSLAGFAFIIGCTRQRAWQLIKAGRVKGVYKDSLGRWVIPERSAMEFKKIQRDGKGGFRYE